jgi:hypothetical protein
MSEPDDGGNPLRDKVVVITGASGGSGAAGALHHALKD